MEKNVNEVQKYLDQIDLSLFSFYSASCSTKQSIPGIFSLTFLSRFGIFLRKKNEGETAGDRYKIKQQRH